jgi:hypothetical protein
MKQELLDVQSFLLTAKNKFAKDLEPLRQECQRVFSSAPPPTIETTALYIPPVPIVPAQKKSSQPVPSTSVQSSHSERSIRSAAPDRTAGMMAPDHPLDVWRRSEALFKDLPTDADIEDLCRPANLASPPTTGGSPVPWRTRIAEMMSAMPESIRKRLVPLPGPPPPPDATAEFWRQNAPSFPLEDLMMRNTSPLHRLIEAFVEARPLERRCPERRCLPVHVLLPRCECDDYMGLPFEDRLEIELIGAGLGAPEETADDNGAATGNTFAEDIEYYKEEVGRDQKRIEALKQEVLAGLPQWREDFVRRAREGRQFQALAQRRLSKP